MPVKASKDMKASEEFVQFAEDVVESLKNVPFKDLDSYEGQVFAWKKGHQKGEVTVRIEIIFPEYKRVFVEAAQPKGFFSGKKRPVLRGFRAYENGVRIKELLDG